MLLTGHCIEIDIIKTPFLSLSPIPQEIRANHAENTIYFHAYMNRVHYSMYYNVFLGISIIKIHTLLYWHAKCTILVQHKFHLSQYERYLFTGLYWGKLSNM